MTRKVQIDRLVAVAQLRKEIALHHLARASERTATCAARLSALDAAARLSRTATCQSPDIGTLAAHVGFSAYLAEARRLREAELQRAHIEQESKLKRARHAFGQTQALAALARRAETARGESR